MVKVICDTSFLIHLANHRIKNLITLDTEIGDIQFLVPEIVHEELNNLSKNEKKSNEAKNTINFIKNFQTIETQGNFADDSLVEYIKNQGGVVATIDKILKIKIKNIGGSVLSIANNRIVLENSKDFS
ncbi:MAG: PIN domain-containing protein [Candidatus Nitrosotenuis sp.]